MAAQLQNHRDRWKHYIGGFKPQSNRILIFLAKIICKPKGNLQLNRLNSFGGVRKQQKKTTFRGKIMALSLHR